MKNLLLFLFGALLFTSCGSSPESHLQEWAKTSLNDPYSFEVIEITKESIFNSEKLLSQYHSVEFRFQRAKNLSEEIGIQPPEFIFSTPEHFFTKINTIFSGEDFVKENFSSPPSISTANKDTIMLHAQYEGNLNRLETEVDRILEIYPKNLSDDQLNNIYLVRYRAKNGFGALIIAENYFVISDTETFLIKD